MDALEFVELAKHGDIAGMEAAGTSFVDSVDGSGVSALMWALYYGQPQAAEWIEARRDQISIFEAAALGRSEIVSEHLERDPALANTKSPDGFTALGFAAYMGHLAAVSLLLDAGADPNTLSENPIGAAPLHSALSNGFVSIAKTLVKRGADPNLAAAGGWTPLHYCADIGDAELAQWLMERGAMPGPVNSEGVSAIQHAEQVGHHEVARVLHGEG